MPPNYVGRSIAGDHEVPEDTDQKLQDVVRLGLEWVRVVLPMIVLIADQRKLFKSFVSIPWKFLL